MSLPPTPPHTHTHNQPPEDSQKQADYVREPKLEKATYIVISFLFCVCNMTLKGRPQLQSGEAMADGQVDKHFLARGTRNKDSCGQRIWGESWR